MIDDRCCGVGTASRQLGYPPPGRVPELADLNVRAPLLPAWHFVVAYRRRVAIGDRRSRRLVLVTSCRAGGQSVGENLLGHRGDRGQLRTLLRKGLRDDPRALSERPLWGRTSTEQPRRPLAGTGRFRSASMAFACSP